MKTKQRNLAIIILSILMVIACGFGVLSTSGQTVKADGTPSVTMVSGASARKTAGEPGIKFTAKIDNYDSNYQYGMLILPEVASYSS